METFGVLMDSTLLLRAALTVLVGYLMLAVLEGFQLESRFKLRHIRGPKPIWLFGNVLAIRKYDFFLFEAFKAWGKKYGKVFKWYWGPQAVVTVRDAEIARQICVKYFKVFPDRSMFYPPQPNIYKEVLSQGITFAKGSYWTSLRGAMQPLFHVQGLKSYCGVVVGAVKEVDKELSTAVAAGTSVDVAAAVSNLTLKAIGEAAFGVPFDTQVQTDDGKVQENALVSAAHFALEHTATLLIFMLVPKVLRPVVYTWLRTFPTKTLCRLNECRCQLYMASIMLIKNAMGRLGMEWKDPINMDKTFDVAVSQGVKAVYAKRMPHEGSLVDLLVRAKNKETGQPLLPHQIVAQSNSVLVAGHDTTSFMITSALYYLSTNPGPKARMLQEIDGFGRDKEILFDDLEKFPYVEAVLQEALRLSPPGWMTSRECVEDITIEGIYIPKGTVIYIDFMGIHHSEEYWADPESFRPERFHEKDTSEYAAKHPFAFLAFGGGPRTCIGYKFALQEGKMALVSLFQKWDFEYDEAMNGGKQPLWRTGITLGYRKGVYLKPVLRA